MRASLTVPAVSGGAQTFAGDKTFTGIVTISNVTESTTAATGALVVTGGIGISGNSFLAANKKLYLGDTFHYLQGVGSGNTKLSASTAAVEIASESTFLVSSTTASTSTTTGSAVISGGVGVAGAIYAGSSILSTSATGGVGYGTGAGGTVTQATSRATGVTLNKVCGDITLVSAAGSTSWQTFTVTNSAVAATDKIVVNQKSGTDKNMIHVTAIAAGSFAITFATTGGTTVEQPVFTFAVIKGVTA